jgi:hypothetical protein
MLEYVTRYLLAILVMKTDVNNLMLTEKTRSERVADGVWRSACTCGSVWRQSGSGTALGQDRHGSDQENNMADGYTGACGHAQSRSVQM